jgi:hypothetical protein
MAAAYWGRTSEESFVDHAGIPSISEQGNRTRDQLFLSSLSDRLIFQVWEVFEYQCFIPPAIVVWQ